jgi:ABC-type lipoprotein release transport system permease subunit
VAVVSELFARTYFGNENPIGHSIGIGGRGNAPRDFEIVGVAATAVYGDLRDDRPPVVYVPYGQVLPIGQMTYVLRTSGDPLQYANAVREALRGADPRVPIANIRTQAAEIDQTINLEIIFARLCTTFALLALVIACVGLYGTMAYAVARRTPEIGIRIALGARQASVVWMVLREVCVLGSIGLAVSLPVALSASRLLKSFLFQMKPNDPYTLAVAVGVLASAALAAGYGPAHRASRINPRVALRSD